MKIKASQFMLVCLIVGILSESYLSNGMNFTPQVVPDPNMASYNAFWDGAVGSRGYWGSLPESPHSVFSPTFNDKGIFN